MPEREIAVQHEIAAIIAGYRSRHEHLPYAVELPRELLHRWLSEQWGEGRMVMANRFGSVYFYPEPNATPPRPVLLVADEIRFFGTREEFERGRI